MALQTEVNVINHTADGSTSSFPYNFRVDDAGHMEVYENGVLTTQDYNVTGVGNPSGGTVDFISYTPASGVIVTLLRVVPMTQVIVYEPYDPFPAKTHERGLDKLTMITQQNSELAGRKIGFAPGSPDQNVSFDSLVGNAGKVYIVSQDEKKFEAGPTGSDIQNAEGYANAAAGSASAAANDANRAEAAAQALPEIQAGDAQKMLKINAGENGYDKFFLEQVARAFTAQQNFISFSLTSGATVSWDLAEAQIAALILDQNTTINAPTNMVNGGLASLMIIQDATGGRTVAWNSVFKFPGGEVPVFNTDPNKITLVNFRSTGIDMKYLGHSTNIA